MRHPASRFLLLLTLALFATGTRAWADDRAEARVHYQAGVKAYASSNYKDAIKEFSAAQQLAPADLNNYNLALCYDKLGDAEPAIQYYRAFLDKQPNADKRAEIEASISRLEAALKSAAAKKAEEQKKIDDKKAEEAKIEEAARKADEAKKADEQRKADEAAAAAHAGTIPSTTVPPTGTGPATQVPVGVGSTGTPGTGQAVSTGDAQLDRVNAINIDAIRDQRLGGQASGLPADNRVGPGGPTAPQSAQPNGPNPNGPMASTNGQAPAPDKPKETPVYKKWWFWAVVAVSAYVVISIATESSNNPNGTGHEMWNRPMPSAAPDGLTLWRF
jgi:hypothetical protein